MYDKELIDKICNLTCSSEEIDIPQTAVNYDHEYPFEKYYNYETIIKAIQKYLDKEWSDKHLAHWACLYSWIISGGFHDDVKKEENSIKALIKEQIVWILDSVSFFDEKYFGRKKTLIYLREVKNAFQNLDLVLKTIENWKGYSSNSLEYENDVLLVNDLDKKYMMIPIDNIENKDEDEYIKFIDEKQQRKMKKELQQNGYLELAL